MAGGGWSGEGSERETDATDGRRRRRFANPMPCAAAEVRLSVMSRRSMSMRSEIGEIREMMDGEDAGIRFSREIAGKRKPREGGE